MTEAAGAVQENAMAKRSPLMTGILFWCGLAVVSSLYITIPLVPVFADAFGASPDQAAWAGSGFSFAYAVGSLFFGPLSDRFGRKQMMLASLVTLSVITPLLGLAGSLPMLIALRAIQGAAAASFAPAALAYAVEMYPQEKRVTAIGFITSGFLISGVAGQVFSGSVSQSLGWPYVFFILGGVYFLSALLLGALLPKSEAQPLNVNLLAPFKQLGTLILQPPLALCYAIAIVILLTFIGMYTALGDYLTRAPFDLSGDQILGVRAAGMIGLLLSPVAGRLAGKFGTRKVLRTGLMLSVAGITLIGCSSYLPIVIFMSIVFVAGISVTVPALISLIGMFAGEARGAAVTLYTFILFIGATLGPIAALTLLKTGSPVLTFAGMGMFPVLGIVSSSILKMPERIS
jgi:MFS family permease